MKNIFIIIIRSFCLTVSAKSVITKELNFMNNVEIRPIEDYLKQDSRLIQADKQIGFVKAFKDEKNTKQDICYFKNIDGKSFKLDNNIVLKVEKTKASPKSIFNKMGQKIGTLHLYEFYYATDENKTPVLDLQSFFYDGEEGFFYARDQFISAVSATSMPFILLQKSPLNVGTASVSFDEKLYPYGQLAWVEHNIYIKVSNMKLPDDVVLKIVEWSSKQVEKVK